VHVAGGVRAVSVTADERQLVLVLPDREAAGQSEANTASWLAAMGRHAEDFETVLDLEGGTFAAPGPNAVRGPCLWFR